MVLGVGLGQAGFVKGTVYAGNGSANQIYLVPAGGAPVRFGTTGRPEHSSDLVRTRQQLWRTNAGLYQSGNIYSFKSSRTPTLIDSIGEDTEGMDIASSAYGQYAGDLLVASEGSGRIRAVTVLQSAPGVPVSISLAETVSTVPLNLGSSGNPVEGFYVANSIL